MCLLWSDSANCVRMCCSNEPPCAELFGQHLNGWQYLLFGAVDSILNIAVLMPNLHIMLGVLVNFKCCCYVIICFVMIP